MSPTARNPAVDADHGTPLNKAIRKLKELFGPIAEKASQSITNLLPGAVPRVVKPQAPTTTTRPASLKEATNRYAINTGIKKNFDGIYYSGRMTSDNGKWYKVSYDDGDEEEMTHRQATQHLALGSFTAGYGHALSAILKGHEQQTNLALDDLKDCQNRAYSVTHPTTGKQMEWRELVRDAATKEDWILSRSNELG